MSDSYCLNSTRHYGQKFVSVHRRSRTKKKKQNWNLGLDGCWVSFTDWVSIRFLSFKLLIECESLVGDINSKYWCTIGDTTSVCSGTFILDVWLAGKYWYTICVVAMLNSWLIGLRTWFGGNVTLSRLLKDIFDKRDHPLICGVDANTWLSTGIDTSWVTGACDSSVTISAGSLFNGNSDSNDDCSIFLYWLRTGRISSIAFDEVTRQSDSNDVCEIWRFIEISTTDGDSWRWLDFLVDW